MNITESVGFFSPYGSLEEALAQWNHDGTQMVAISEPKPVLVRKNSLDTGKPFLFQSHQCYVNVRYSPRGRWSKCNLLTFSTDRYGTPEQRMVRVYLFTEIPGSGKGWTLAVFATSKKDAVNYVKRTDGGGRFVGVILRGKVDADCGAVTEYAQLEIRQSNI